MKSSLYLEAGVSMAVTTRALRVSQGVPTQRRRWLTGFRPAVYGGTLLLVGVAIYLLVGFILEHAQTLIDDVRYGRPRTMQVVGYVGHNEVPGRPSHFIAMNIDRQTLFIELPGGDATQARSFQGPYLFGANEDLTPVMLTIEDANGDGANDVLLHVRREVVVFVNHEGSFRPATEAEVGQLKVAPR
jgi:hypothetical protein